MTTEKEKAKRYDEALEWMRELYPGLHGATKEDAEHYFPELKESEDEIHREWILEYLYDGLQKSDEQFKGQFKSAIAWLEKQKESGIKWFQSDNIKNPDKPYIDKAGMFYTTDGRMCYASEIEKQKEQKPITINQDEKEFLADEITAFLCNYDKEFDGEDPVPSEVAEHFYLLGKQAQEQKPVINIDQLKSLMLQYLQEAANEKDDSAIEADTDKWARKILGYDFEQKPADEQFPPLEGLDAIKAKYYDNGFKNGFDEGVESVKQAEWSPTKEQMVALNWAANGMLDNDSPSTGDIKASLRSLYNGLQSKSIKPAEFDEYKIIKKHITEDSLSSEVNKRLTECGWYVTDEKPKEWSEEDEKIRKFILEIIKAYDGMSNSTKEKCISYLEKQKEQKPTVSRKEILYQLFQNGSIALSDYLYLTGEQKPAKWSKEDEKMLLSIINDFRIGAVSTIGQEQWLQLLPERFNLQPSLEHLQKEKVYDIMAKLTNLSYSNLIPFNSEEYKKINEITSDVFDLLKYPIEKKQEQKPEAKLTGWVARDREFDSYYGTGLILFNGKPRRTDNCWNGDIIMQLPWQIFPDLKWVDSPMEVEIIIRKK